MNYPNHSDKWKKKALFSAADYISYSRKQSKHSLDVPENMVLCYSRKLIDFAKKNYETKTENNVLTFNSISNLGLYTFFGIGAPAAVSVFEELVARGGKRFISTGLAGSISKSLAIGDLVLCDQAIRDEGTSFHYLAPEKYAYPSKELTTKIEEVLKQKSHPFTKGCTWTTDAPYRETVDEVRAYQQEGVLTVEMEASALFSVAQVNGVDVASLFTISDSLAELKWQPQFHKGEQRLGDLFEIVSEALVGR